MDYVNKHVLVLGLGESGLATAKWLVYCGARVRIADTRCNEPAVLKRLSILRLYAPNSEFISTQFFLPTLLKNINFIVISSSLKFERDCILLTATVIKNNIPIISEIELFGQALLILRKKYSYTPKVLAITGTNGKTTVTKITSMLCNHAGLKTVVAGNISPALLEVLHRVVSNNNIKLYVLNTQENQTILHVHSGDNTFINQTYINKLPDVWILELSSFQLHTVKNFQADIATILNITEDHLDWHESMTSYIADKAKIFGKNTLCILNRNDTIIMQMIIPNKTFITVGIDEPNTVDSFGIIKKNGILWLAYGVPFKTEKISSAFLKKNKKKLIHNSFKINTLISVNSLKIRGLHNVFNVLVSLALCHAIHISLTKILHKLCHYVGERHRIELVMKINNVNYYNDSKSTNVGATIAALNSLGSSIQLNRILLIAGGDGKGQDFTRLIWPLKKYTRVILLIGRDANYISDAIISTGLKIIHCISLEKAVYTASTLAKTSDAVLLSPACASVDMFRNYIHRANIFIKTVHKLSLLYYK